MTLPTPPEPDVLLAHAAFVRRVACATLKNDDLTDDVVQETWLAALEDGSKRRGPWRVWLGGVARRQAANLVRRRAGQQQRERRAAKPEALPSTAEVAAQAEMGRHVVGAVLSLPEPYRDALLLRYFEALPPRDIAKRLALPVETVRTRIKRGLQKLREALDKTQGERRGGWRAVLLPLAGVSQAGSGVPLAVVAATGGVIVGKKLAVLLVALLLLGGGVFLSGLLHSKDAEPRGPTSGALVGDAKDTAAAAGPAPTLRGTGEPEDGASLLPAFVDLAAVDRDRHLHGVVVDAKGRPVAGARLQVIYYPWMYGNLMGSFDTLMQEEAGPAMQSARDGTFALELHPGDLVSLRVNAAGFARQERASVQAGERLRVVMQAGVMLALQAETHDGRPAAGLRVWVMRFANHGDQYVSLHATTVARGRAMVEHLPPGLALNLFPLPVREGWGSPGGSTVTLPAKGVLEHRFVLPLGRTLRGRVTDAVSGQPLAGARVGREWLLLTETRTDDDGRYVLHGWTGQSSKEVHVVAKGYGRAAALVKHSQGIDFQLNAALIVKGRLLGSEGEPVRDAHIMVKGSQPAGMGREEISLAGGRSDADGVFEIGGLRADMPHDLVVVAPGYGRTLLELTNAEMEAVIDLGDVRLPAPCSVRGRVLTHDGEPLPRKTVYCFPADTKAARHMRVERFTDDLGRFRFPDLSPGAYTIALDRNRIDKESRTILLESEGAQIDVVLTADAPPTPPAAPAAPTEKRSLRIRVRLPSGDPATGIRVCAYAKDMKPTTAVVDAEGTCSLSVAAGPVTVGALLKPEAPFQPDRPLHVLAGQTEVEIVPIPAAVTTGVLLDPEGKPIEGAEISLLEEGIDLGDRSTDRQGRFVLKLDPQQVVDLLFVGTARTYRGGQSTQMSLPYAGRLAGVRAGSKDVVLRTVHVSEDRSLTIEVLDPKGRPVSDVDVFTQPLLSVKGRASSDTNGRVHFDGLAARSLRLRLCVKAGPARPWLDPKPLRVMPEGQKVTFRLEQAILLEGVLLRPDGTTVPGAYVIATIGSKRGRSTRTDEAGRFWVPLDPAAPEPVSLSARVKAADGGYLDARLENVGPADGPVTLQLQPPK